jgi:hypothetical protein
MSGTVEQIVGRERSQRAFRRQVSGGWELLVITCWVSKPCSIPNKTPASAKFNEEATQ